MVVPSPGEQVEDDVAGVWDASLASGVVEVTVEVGEGWEAESGASDAPDDVWGFEGLRGNPVVGDSFGDAAEGHVPSTGVVSVILGDVVQAAASRMLLAGMASVWRSWTKVR